MIVVEGLLPVLQWCAQQWSLSDHHECFHRPSFSTLPTVLDDRSSNRDCDRTSRSKRIRLSDRSVDRRTYIEEKTKFLVAGVEFRDGRSQFSLSEFRQEKDELFEIDFIILSVIVDDHIDQSLTQRIDIHFGNAEKIFTSQIPTITFIQGFKSAVQSFDLLASEAYDEQTERSSVATDDLSFPPSSTTASYLPFTVLSLSPVCASRSSRNESLSIPSLMRNDSSG